MLNLELHCADHQVHTQAQPTEPLVLICNYEKLIKIIIKSFMEQNKRNAKKVSMKI
jgi:hypothetical protein